MYIDAIYPVPDLGAGHFAFCKRGNDVYVQLILSHKYVPAKKNTVMERVSIGKLVDPNDRTCMYANLAFLQHFPDVQPIEEDMAHVAHGIKVKHAVKLIRVKNVSDAAVEQGTVDAQDIVVDQGAVATPDAAVEQSAVSAAQDTAAEQDTVAAQDTAAEQDTVAAQDTAAEQDTVAAQDTAAEQGAVAAQEAAVKQDLEVVREVHVYPDASVPPVMVVQQEAVNKRSAITYVGAYIILQHIAEQYQLKDKLELAIGKYGATFLDLAFYFIICESNVCQHYDVYAKGHPLFTAGMRAYSDSTLSRILINTPPDSAHTFLELWNESQDRSQLIYVAYDSTNKNSQAGDIDFVNFGHAKVDIGTRIYNVSLANNQTNQVPLYYELYDGAINDVSQQQYFVQKLYALGYRKISFILDRGYFSRKNIEYMDSLGYSFLIMVKGCKDLVSDLIDKKRNSFELDFRYRVEGTDVFATTVERELYDGDTKTRYFHLCYSPEKARAELDKLMELVDKTERDLAAHEGQVYKASAECERYFSLTTKQHDGQEVLSFAIRNDDAITKDARRCGYFCLISSNKISAQEAYEIYRGRDSTEKLFMVNKTFLGSKSARVHSNNALENKTLIEFVALIVRSRLFNLLKTEMRRLNLKHNHLTVPAAIRALEQIRLVRCKDHNSGSCRYLLEFANSKPQKDIFRAVGLSEMAFMDRVKVLIQKMEAVNASAALPLVMEFKSIWPRHFEQ